MAEYRITELPDASAFTGSELQPFAQLSTTTLITATTISASSVGNVLADSGNGFVTAGFAGNQQISISGFTGGGVANNLTATIVSVSAGLLYVDVPLTSVAAGDTVTITRWLSRKATPAAVQAGAINTATGKTTPVDADALGIIDSAASNALKKLTWANLKATLKAYTDTLYALTGAITGSGLTMATGKLLGRSTASTGAVEEITVGTGLSLSAGTLSSTAIGDVVGPASAVDNNIAVFDSTTGKLIKDGGKTIAELNTYSVGFFFTTTPTASEVLLLHTFPLAVTFPDEWSGSVGDIGTNPTSSFVLDVQKNGASVGTVTISTGGAFTFATTGTTVAFAIGDQLKIVGPGSADATAANVSITFLGAK